MSYTNWSTHKGHIYYTKFSSIKDYTLCSESRDYMQRKEDIDKITDG